MKRRELKNIVGTLKDWELSKLSELYRQLGEDAKKEIVDAEHERRIGLVDGQISFASL